MQSHEDPDCPVNDPSCEGGDDQCHDACENPMTIQNKGTETLSRPVAKRRALVLGHDLGRFSKVEFALAPAAQYYRAVCHSCGRLAIAEEIIASDVPAERRAEVTKCGTALIEVK